MCRCKLPCIVRENFGCWRQLHCVNLFLQYCWCTSELIHASGLGLGRRIWHTLALLILTPCGSDLPTAPLMHPSQGLILRKAYRISTLILQRIMHVTANIKSQVLLSHRTFGLFSHLPTLAAILLPSALFSHLSSSVWQLFFCLE